MLMKSKILLLLLTITFASSYANELTFNQQKQLISNLNYLQYSTARIKMSENKAIAEDIYYSIINELKIEFINNRDLNFQYSEFLEKCKNLKLTQDEKDFIKQLNEKQQKSAYLSAFSNFGSVFVPGQSPQQMVASLVYTTVANAAAIANQKNQLKMQLDKDMFYLNQKIVGDIFDMQTSLFATSAKLLGGKNSEGRINENSMNMFLKAINLPTFKERKNALSEQQLQQNLSYFPPYWFELGNTYQNLGETSEAIKCYDKFMALKNTDIIHKDKYYVNLIKNRIQIILGTNSSNILTNAITHKAEILNYIELLKANYLDSESGEKNSYLAKIYYLIGETESSLQCLNYIIESKSIYPELIEEAVALKILIEASKGGEKAEMYQTAYNFGLVKFGNETIDYSVYNVKSGWFSRFKEWGGNIFSRNKIEDSINDQNKIKKDWLCFEIPNNLRKNYDITFDIDDKLYIPAFRVNDQSNTSIGFLNVNYDDIDTNVIKMHCKSLNTLKEIVVEFSMERVTKKEYKAANKAYKRIGSDIVAHNPQTAIEFGKILLKYDYEVDDEEKLAKKVRKQKNRWGKKNNKTDDEVNSEVSKTLSDKLTPDLKYIKERLRAVETAYYKRSEGILYSPKIVSYNGDYYLVGIISIYDSSKEKAFSFDSNGDMSYHSEPSAFDDNVVISELQHGAFSGDINSMVSLGILYIEGNNINNNPQEGIRWLLTAVNNVKEPLSRNDKISIARACKYLGECYLTGEGVAKDKKSSRKWFNKAKEYGFNVDEKYTN